MSEFRLEEQLINMVNAVNNAQSAWKKSFDDIGKKCEAIEKLVHDYSTTEMVLNEKYLFINTTNANEKMQVAPLNAVKNSDDLMGFDYSKLPMSSRTKGQIWANKHVLMAVKRTKPTSKLYLRIQLAVTQLTPIKIEIPDQPQPTPITQPLETGFLCIGQFGFGGNFFPITNKYGTNKLVCETKLRPQISEFGNAVENFGMSVEFWNIIDIEIDDVIDKYWTNIAIYNLWDRPVLISSIGLIEKSPLFGG